MEFRKNSKGRATRVSMLFYTLFLLSYTGFASAGLLQWRQASDVSVTTTPAVAESTTAPAGSETSPATNAGTSAGATAGTSLGTTAEATSEPTTTNTKLDSTDASQATTAPTANSISSNGTEAASLTSATATPTATELTPTNDPNKCHVNKMNDAEFLGNPFCKPSPGQVVLIGKNITVQWDTSIFEANTTDYIWLSYFQNPEVSTATSDAVFNETALDSQGSAILHMNQSFLDQAHGASANMTLFLASGGKTLTGPTFMLSNATNTTSPDSSDSDKKKLGEKVGIPVGLVILGVALIGLGAFICMRRRAARGYGVGRSKGQGFAPVAAAGGRGHRRDASFHDEPTRGVELQNRNRGANAQDDNWDWGSQPSSPTTAGKGSNAFRDELGRQRNTRGF